jgi:hypothetical protein
MSCTCQHLLVSMKYCESCDAIQAYTLSAKERRAQCPVHSIDKIERDCYICDSCREEGWTKPDETDDYLFNPYYRQLQKRASKLE